MDDDPWDWSVDRVVQELCTTNRSWEGSRGAISNPVALEEVLRDQEVTGSILLADVDDEVLREFGLTKLSPRIFVKSACQELRLKSIKYHEWYSKHNYTTLPKFHSRSVHESNYQPTISNHGQHSFQPTSNLNRVSEVGNRELDSPSNKRLKTGPQDQINDQQPRFLDSSENLLTLSNRKEDTAPEHTQPNQVETNSKKRKRIAPTLITSVLDANVHRGIPTDADNVILNDPSYIKPGEVYTDENGKKKLKPVQLQGGSDFAPISSLSSLGGQQRGKSLLSENTSGSQASSLVTGYLGKNKMAVDEIFYEGVSVGEDMQATVGEADEFSMVSKGTISTGRRLYIHNITKRLLLSEPKVFTRHGKAFAAVLPYSTKLAPRHQEPSFTLYLTSADGKVHVRRENISVWPEIDPDATGLPSQTPMIEGDAPTDWDPSYLDKYRLLEGGDTILPLYGDSDEENEYDVDTWAEMEKERGEKLEKPSLNLRKGRLDQEAVKEALTEGIAEIVKAWQTLKLPKLQSKAWKIWAKARRDGNKRLRIQKLQQHLEHLKSRVTKMSKEIMSEIWTGRKQILKQARIMEETIFQRESHAWEITILESSSAPSKPIAHQQGHLIPKTEAHINDEEGESIGDSESNASSADEDLDQFIVSDGVGSLTDNNLGLNITGAEDDSDSSLFGPGVGNVTPTREPIAKFGLPEGSATSVGDFRGGTHHVSSPLQPRQAVDQSCNPQKSSNRALFNPQEVIELSSDNPDVPEYPGQIDLLTPTKPRGSQLLSSNTKPSKLNIKLVIDSSATKVKLDKKSLPPYDDPKAVAQHSLKDWESIHDKERLIIHFLYQEIDFETRDALLKAVKTLSENKLWSGISTVANALAKNIHEAEDINPNTFRLLKILVRMLLMYIHCKHLQILRFDGDALASRHLHTIEASYDDSFPDFFQLCRKLPKYFGDVQARSQSVDESDEDEEPRAAIRGRPRQVTTDDDEGAQEAPRKRRKKVKEDVVARAMRNQDRERLAEQDLRRLKLQARLDKDGNADVERGRIIINETKFDDKGYIYINEKIGQRIKPHQVDGVRFMWNQLVMDVENMQGCLLAHTMGLGKTMQTITLLVAIAEAAQSTDEKIHSQIPAALKVCKTLVLCPPGLIDNWMDEFLMWAPRDIFPGLWKIDASILELRNRMRIIETWHEDGGILVIGYEMFRRIMNNNPDRQGNRPLNEEQHTMALEALVEGPSIIVADEAHKLKNSASGITTVAQEFKSMSRIALTGSPLANNVEEYHTMIDWIAPNYLGPIAEFRQKYVEPIQAGLYFDSDPSERKLSAKMLRLLTDDLSPKVHRADMTVLRHDLPPKTEFVIAVPLTPLQHAAYTIYVRAMLSSTHEVSQTTLWHWLAVLTLLCNHPSCFKAKLTERKQEAAKSKSKQRASTSAEDLEEVNNWKVGASEDLVRQELELFDQENDIASMLHSNKVKILCEILDASKQAGDKVLLFSSSLPTLNYLEKLCADQNRKFNRLDGSTVMSKRQKSTKAFNADNTELYLISTKAGGLGLNLFGANRVVIFDFKFNPIDEEQAVGRAFRIGQKKPVFVYRLIAGGTFEELIHNTAIFKKQLASRVVDKKKTVSWAKKRSGEFLFEPKNVAQQDLEEFKGKDELVLDEILNKQATSPIIRSIVQTDTFEKIAIEELTAEEENALIQQISDQRLQRWNPREYDEVLKQRHLKDIEDSRRRDAERKEAQKQDIIRRVAALHERSRKMRAARQEAARQEEQADTQIAAAQNESVARDSNTQDHLQLSTGQVQRELPTNSAAVPTTVESNQNSSPESHRRQNSSPKPSSASKVSQDINRSTTFSSSLDKNRTPEATRATSKSDAIDGTVIPDRPSPNVKKNRSTSSVAVVTPSPASRTNSISQQATSPNSVSSLEVLSIFQDKVRSLTHSKSTGEVKREPSTIVSILERILQPLSFDNQKAAMKAVCVALRSNPETVTGLLSKSTSAKIYFQEFINKSDDGKTTEPGESSIQNVGTPFTTVPDVLLKAAKDDDCQVSSSVEAEVNIQPAKQQGLPADLKDVKPADFQHYDHEQLEE